MTLHELIDNESERRKRFPVVCDRVYLAHAGVSPLPRAAVVAMQDFLASASADSQDNPHTEPLEREGREVGAALIGCDPDEVALLGPTTLGLNLVALGLPWQPGDEVVFYGDDYPANVYPWQGLADRGVTLRRLHPDLPGRITPELVQAALSERTRLVALASCHFLSGRRIDIDAIGAMLRERGVLFCVDGIQTVGAFPTSVANVDFLSADSHKWMLGPAGAGIFYVRRELHSVLRPALLGSWNVYSPQFIAQEQVAYYAGARRYECGMLNLPGIAGMIGAGRMLLALGIDAIADRIRELRALLVDLAVERGYELYGGPNDEPAAQSGIVTLRQPARDLSVVAKRLTDAGVAASLRHNRKGEPLLRFSPHFYNTFSEIEIAANLLG